MKISTEKLPESQVLMTIEIEPERLDKARERALRKLAPKAHVAGFRPGKAPPALIRQYFGEERIQDEALDELAQQVYREALQSEKEVDPIARGSFEGLSGIDPLVLKFRIPVRPSVELGDYRAVRVKSEPVVVEESRVESILLEIRRGAATFEPVETPLKWRDRVRMEVEAWVEVEGAAATLVDPSGKALVASKQRDTVVERQEAEVQLVEGREALFPGFEEQLLGHAKGETLEFDLPVPEGVHSDELQGKQCHFTVTILETKEEVLPDEDDELAKQVGDGFESLEALRIRIRDDIRTTEERALRSRQEDEILGMVTEEATVEYPPVMLEAEVDRILHDQAGHIERGDAMERYLATIGKTEEQVRADLQPVADMRLRRSLVLSKLAEAEDIAVTDEEVDAQIERLAEGAGEQAARLRQLFGSPDGRSTIRRNQLTQKTLDRLVEIATPEGAPSGAKPPPKRSRAKKQKDEAVTGATPTEETTEQREDSA